MISEERVKLMTRMASYEEGEGKKNVAVAKHFRTDYVGAEVLKAVICVTLACMIVFGAYIYYDFEKIMNDFYDNMDLLEVGADLLKKYLYVLVIYCVIIYITFTVKYSKAKHNLKIYFNNLRLLGTLYVKETAEEKEKEIKDR